jgi:hypothetical protein
VGAEARDLFAVRGPRVNRRARCADELIEALAAAAGSVELAEAIALGLSLLELGAGELALPPAPHRGSKLGS